MARPNKPTAAKVAAGNPGKRSTSKQEPDPDYVTDTNPPAYLPEGAKAIWREEAPRLARARLLTVVDLRAFGMLCVAIWQYETACKKLEGPDGSPLKGDGLSPSEQVRSMNFKQCLALYDRFGMTPRSRTQIQVQPQVLLPFETPDGNKAAKLQGDDYFSRVH